MKKTLAIAVGSILTAAAPVAFGQYHDRDYRDNPRYDRPDTARVIERSTQSRQSTGGRAAITGRSTHITSNSSLKP